MYPFYKMHGLENDFVIFFDHSNIENPLFNIKTFCINVAKRRLGIGCDQIIFIDTKRKENPYIRFFNADGSEAEVCGNGTRCAAKLFMQKFETSSVTFDSLGGQLICKPSPERDEITVTFKKPTIIGDISLYPEDVFLRTGTHVDVGNPHLVILDPREDFLSFGPDLEKHPSFPNRTNVGFATVRNSKTIDLKVWERGAGITQACGSGACAAAFAAYEKGLCEKIISVYQPGGMLSIQINEETISQTGPAELTFEGILALSYLL
jgi:diaminopimelate epimerase